MLSPTLTCSVCGCNNQLHARVCRRCGQPLQASKYHSATGHLLPNALLKQHYKILEPVGQGGFGAVYRAEDTELGNRYVAVKEMNQNALSPQERKEAAEAFRREAVMLARLQHPNLPTILEHFEEHQHWYLVMSFIEGETLEKYLLRQPGGRLPLHKAIEVGIQLCTVLDYLHNQRPPIIFRDLKPDNIIYTPDGHIYLIDFGIARHFKPGKAKDTQAYGSPGYAAPEQHGSAQTTPLADMYSLGVTLHRMISGHDPAQSPFHFPPLQSLVPAVPDDLATCITRMLAMDKSKRPTNMSAVKQTLQTSLPVPSSAPAPQRKPQPATPASQPKPQPTATQAGAPLPSPRSGPAVPNPFGRAGTLLARTEPGGAIQNVEWSPDGTRIAVTYRGSVHIWKLDGKPPQTFSHDALEHGQLLVWSPDGKHIACVDNHGTVQVWKADGSGQPLTFPNILQYRSYDYGNTSNTIIAWSPDSTRIAILARDETVQVIPLRGGEPVTYKSRSLLTRNREHCFFLAVWWSPDGKRIGAVANDGTVQIWQINGSRERFVYSREKYPSNQFSVAVWSPDGTNIAFIADETIHLWNIYKDKRDTLSYTNKGGKLAWSPNGKRIACVTTDGTVRVWDIPGTGQPLMYKDPLVTNINHYNYFNSLLAWSPDSQRLAFLREEVHIWYPGDDDTLVYRGHSRPVRALTWSPDGKQLASLAENEKTIQIWNATDTFIAGDNPGNPWSFAQLPDGTRLASTPDGKKIHVWETNERKDPFVYQHFAPSRYNIGIPLAQTSLMSPDGKRIASVNGTTVQVENVNQGRAFPYPGHTNAVLAVTWSPDGTRIASISQDGAIHVWNVNGSGKPVIYRGHAATIQSLAWSPDSKYIVSASKAANDAVHVWATDGLGQAFIYKGHNYGSWGVFVTSVAWSPDGRQIASSTTGVHDAPNFNSKAVHVWNADGHGQAFIYKGHDAGVILLDWSPDSTRLVSVTESGQALVWSVG